MKPYPSYKESGVDWIGKIPSHWTIGRISHYFRERKETVDDRSYPPLSVTMNGILNQLVGVAKTDDNDNRKKVCKNDFVINSRSDRKGASGLSFRDGSVSLINTVLEPISIYPPYTHHIFKSYGFVEEYFKFGRGIHLDLWSTKYSTMKNIKIPDSSIQEQQQISKYLDRKTEQVDTLIEKTKEKIELLKEQRTTIINNVVTKGLNPNVEMKDSGVEWIGKIPSHWKVSKLKYEVEFYNNLRVPLSSEERSERQGPYRYYGSTSVIDHIDDFNYDGEYILVAEDGGNLVLRNLRLSFLAEGQFWVNNHAHVMSTGCHSSNVYYCELLELTDFTTLISGSAQPKLTFESIRNLPVVVPPKEERTLIASKIDLISNNLASILNTETRRLELLKEFRLSLISEVVTGKVDVREEVIL